MACVCFLPFGVVREGAVSNGGAWQAVAFRPMKGVL